MQEFLLKFNPILMSLFATIFTWGVTALGAGMVFFKTIERRILNSMLGFSVMMFLDVALG